MEKSDYPFLTVGDRIYCNSWRDLLKTSFQLSSEGYGVSVIGFADMSDNVLTITADKVREPEKDCYSCKHINDSPAGECECVNGSAWEQIKEKANDKGRSNQTSQRDERRM